MLIYLIYEYLDDSGESLQTPPFLHQTQVAFFLCGLTLFLWFDFVFVDDRVVQQLSSFVFSVYDRRTIGKLWFHAILQGSQWISPTW